MTRRRLRGVQLDLDLGGAARVERPSLVSRASGGRQGAFRRSPAPAPKPWACTVLAVDTARTSGFAIYCRGVLGASGEVDTLDAEALRSVTVEAVALGLVTVLVLETPFGGSVDVVAALGQARERWLSAWRSCSQARGRVVLVQPSTWRGPVLGRKWIGVKRDDVRAQELLVARAHAERADMGHDEAAAILIGYWACHAAEVGRAIGQRAVGASLEAWGVRSPNARKGSRSS